MVRATGKPIPEVARDLGINEGTLGNWLARIAGAVVSSVRSRSTRPSGLS